MKKLISTFIFCISMASAIEYSLRIKALGTEFVNLIPDYETDLYMNPNLIGNEKLIGITYDRRLYSPVIMRFCGNKFAWLSQYWGSYREENNSYTSYNGQYVSIKDLWILDLRGRMPKFLAGNAWYLYNDGFYRSSRWQDTRVPYRDKSREIEYLTKAHDIYAIGKYYKIILRPCFGYYQNYHEYDGPGEYLITEKSTFIISGEAGLYFRKFSTPSNFISFYIIGGGPVSTAAIDNLPFLFRSHIFDNTSMYITYFARTLVIKTGVAKGFPIDDQSFVAVGLRDSLLIQKTFDADTNIYMRGVRNMLSLPIGIEYVINRISVRFGTCFYYHYNGDEQWDDNSIIQQYRIHELSMDFKMGLCWRLNDYGQIDLCCNKYINDIDSYSIYLKYVFR